MAIEIDPRTIDPARRIMGTGVSNRLSAEGERMRTENAIKRFEAKNKIRTDDVIEVGVNYTDEVQVFDN